ncbi:NAD(P)-dependent oxidoreductase [Ruania zhangjianzhongii]|uniref:NAD(P)-dependent oxidoreductase n=1 Tax=Ruania zhangjianzhongii TaxID=2603206 RepID=UPI0011C72110|nr:NAD(P)-dependent oxidoreductase [Ruania zhangjianzhongii]
MATLLCLSDYPEELVQSWVAGLDVEVVIAARSAAITDLTEELRRAEVVIGDAARQFPLDAAAIAELHRCRLIMHPAVGLDGVIDPDAAAARGIRVRSAPGYNAEAVADWVVMAMLMLLREAVAAEQALRTDGWSRRPLGRELGALTVGIVGYGAIGRAVHQRLRGFGTEVLISDPRPAADTDAAQVELDELLRGSDVVTLHAPLTTSTRHLLDAGRLAQLRPGSVLVNAARGELVDERALATALAAGRPQAAALDVFTAEPLATDSPLRSLPNVYLSPHVAAGTEQARARVRALVGEVVRAELGEPAGG